MRSEKIYVASSWKNPHQPEIVQLLRAEGYEAYDFRFPHSGGYRDPDAPIHGFSWKQIDNNIGSRKDMVTRFRSLLYNPLAQQAFKADHKAMMWADTCVLVMPSGRSAHIEAGWMAGAGKKLVIYMPPASQFCRLCHETGWVDGDQMRNIKCRSCDGTGYTMLWDFGPELMYLLGGDPEVIVSSNAGLLDRLAV